MKFRYFLPLLTFASLLFACQPQETTTSSNAADSSAVTLPLDPNVLCLQQPDQICVAGVWFAVLGEPINNLPLDDLGPLEVADSSLVEEGYVYVKRTVYLNEGEVVIEGTFLEEDKASEEDLNSSRVHRIYFRSPDFHTTTGIKAGDPLRKVLEVYNVDELQILSIPEYETVVLQLPEAGNMFLHFSDPGNALANALGDKLSAALLPDSWQIREIVVM